VGVIVASAAGAMVAQKLVGDVPLPWLTILFGDFAIPLLFLPLVWITAALLVRRNPRLSDAPKNLAFATGVFLVALFVVLGGTAFVQPLLTTHDHPGMEAAGDE
jgi:hypothetical protein